MRDLSQGNKAERDRTGGPTLSSVPAPLPAHTEFQGTEWFNVHTVVIFETWCCHGAQGGPRTSHVVKACIELLTLLPLSPYDAITGMWHHAQLQFT